MGIEIKRYVSPTAMGFYSSLLLILFFLLVGYFEQQRSQAAQHSQTTDKLSHLKSKLEAAINSNIYLTDGLISFVATHPELEQDTFHRIANNLLHRHNYIRNIGLAPNNIISFIHPIKGNEKALGLNYAENKKQWPAVKKAIDANKTVVAGPVNLVQGGRAFISRTPIYIDANGSNIDKQYWGLASIVIDQKQLLGAADFYNPRLDIRVAIRGVDGLGKYGGFIDGEQNIFNETPVVLDVQLPGGGEWQLAALPKEGWGELSPYQKWIFTGGGILSLFVGFTVFIWLNTRLNYQQKLINESEALARSEKKYRALINTTDTGYLICDQDGNVVDANQEYVRLTGHGCLDDILGKNIIGWTAPHDLERNASEIKTCMEQGFVKNLELDYEHSDGTLMPIEINAKVVEAEGGGKIIALCRDITDRKKAEELLREKERFQEQLLNDMIAFVAVLNPDGEVIFVNNTPLKVGGLKLEDVVGKKFFDVSWWTYSDKVRDMVVHDIEQCSSGKTLVHDVQIKKADGTLMWIEYSMHPILDMNGNVQYLIPEGRDISVRKIMENELTKAKNEAEMASRTKSEFLANMSHEIRTPMNAITGFIDLTLEEEISPKVMRNLNIVKTSTRSLLGIINDILDFSKIDSGKLVIENIDFTLHDILLNLEIMFREKAAERGNKFIVKTSNDVPDALIGDPLRLGQVFVNVVANAIKFTSDGEVSLVVSCGERYEDRVLLQFSVRDTGIGIAKEKLDNIFNAFTQADSSITRKHGGTGLGLTITRKLVKLMGGDLSVSSTLGEGTVFTFSLDMGVQVDDEQQLGTFDFQGKKILIVDDDIQVSQVHQKMLQRSGIDVELAEFPSSAMEKLRRATKENNPFDLVLMDFMMQEQDGITTAKEIKNDPLLAETPVVLLTGYGSELLKQRATEVSISAYLHKPISRELLLDNIQMILTKNRNLHAAQEKSSPKQLFAGHKILLVEDNEFNVMLAKEILEKAEFTVEEASNGREALETINTSFDAVLMDVQMPEMDGFEATRLIRQQPQFAKTPIIAMTAHAISGYRQKCIDAGMNDYITKPFRPDELFAVLSHNMSQSKEEGKSIRHSAQEKCCDDDLSIDPQQISQHLQKKYGFSSAKADMLLHCSKKTLTECLCKAEECLVQSDFDSLSFSGHTMKGILGNLGLAQLASVAERIEKRQVRKTEEQGGSLRQQLQMLKNSLSTFIN